MNDDPLDPLEERLRALRPGALPPDLLNRLLAAEPPPVRHRSLRFPAVAGAFVLAVIVLTVALVARWQRPPASSAPALARQPVTPQPADFRVYLPAARNSTLLSVSEGAVVDAGPERQMRLVRAVWLDDTTYIGDDRTVLHRQTARTEIIPVALDTF